MIRRPPRSTQSRSSAASDVYKRQDVYYAGGLIIGKNRGVPYVRHAGQFAGFITDFIRYPDHKLSVAVLCNGGDLIAPEYTGKISDIFLEAHYTCLLYTSPSPRDRTRSRMPSSA
eukprot:TRINITY_DN2745_c0_g1_i1.p1 TRINITY_DN2745_c0_g1~~TRINITY_DN2745_c0_g1_i1.p1  ORF type:complete len:115 (+),score=42.70 TRINITY_DN2745_c0_g1_i1:79-423(+)